MPSKPLKKILVVDDDQDILTIVCYCLERLNGVSILCVNSGERAIKQAPEFLPDLILLDILMPKMDGIATLKALRSMPAFARVPVIFITASVQKEKVEEYLKMGDVDIITKPFDPLTLATQVQAIWECHQKC